MKAVLEYVDYENDVFYVNCLNPIYEYMHEINYLEIERISTCLFWIKDLVFLLSL